MPAAPTKGDLTRAEQVGVANGADNGQRSVQRFGYDQYGNRTLVADPRGNEVTTIYDAYYRSFPVEVRHPNGRSGTMSYDFTFDALKSSTDMNGTVTEHRHDAFGRPSTSWVVGFGSSDLPNEVYWFGDLGKSGVSAPFYISYEKRLGTQAGSNEKTWGTQWYDGIGRLVQEVTPRDATSSIVVNRTYTSTGQLDGVTLPYMVGHAISSTYTLPDATRPKTTTYYDGIGRATTVVNPDGSKATYDHNWLRWTLTMDESGAHQEWKTTDPLGRLHMVVNYDTSTSPMSEPNVGYSYDLLEGAGKANGHGYEYDARGLVLADVVTTTFTTRSYRVGYAYDTGARLASVTHPDPAAERVDVRYNQMGTGLPQSLTSSIVGNPQPVYNALYNERGQLLTLEQGSAGSNNLLTSSFTYDEASTKRGWLTRTQVTSNGGTSVHLDLNLGYTADGNFSSLKQLAGGTNSPVFTNTFGYDGFDRLCSSTSSNSSIFPAESYTFDERLSRMASRSIAGTSHSYTYGDPAHKDAPTAYRGNSYSYDAAGNQITAPGQTRTFDAENRLARIVQGTTTSEFVYDTDGKRVLKSVTTGTTTKRTLYVGNLYEEELTGTSTPPYISYYILGSKLVGMRRANQASMNGQFRLVSDHLGSANLMVDTSAPPQVVERRYHKPHGEIAFQFSSNSSLTTYGFTGQRLDSESGLMYFEARFYDPVLSYFISADPTTPDPTEPADYQRYLYVRGNPLRYIDTSGYGPDDHYVFVNGCDRVSGTAGCEGAPPTFEAYVEQWAGYIEFLKEMYLVEGGGKPEDLDKWLRSHVKFVTVRADARQGAKAIQSALLEITTDGGIHLIGHSYGGTAVHEYLAEARETATGIKDWGITLDRRSVCRPILEASPPVADR